MTGRGNGISNQSPRFIFPKNDGAFLLQGPSAMSFVLLQGQQYLIPISNELVGSFVQQTPTFSQANFLVSSAPTVINAVEKPDVSVELQELPPALDKVSDEQEIDENRESAVVFSCERAFSKEADDFKKSVNADGIVLHQINGFVIEESERPLSPELANIKNYKEDILKDVIAPKAEETLRKERRKAVSTTPTVKAPISPVKRSGRITVETKIASSPPKSIEKPKKRRSELTQLLNMDFGPKAGGRILLKTNEDTQKKRRSFHDRPENDILENRINSKTRRFSDIPTSRISSSQICSKSSYTTPHTRQTRQTKTNPKHSNCTKNQTNKKDTNSKLSKRSLPNTDRDEDLNSNSYTNLSDERSDAEGEYYVQEEKPGRTLRSRKGNSQKLECSKSESSVSSTEFIGQSPKKIYYEPWGTPPYKVINVVNLVCSPGS
ncbi:unnamed protein product [Auanema sp. JU1783]|nr:unnamed protein product [Auanema sp. JU1783]